MPILPLLLYSVLAQEWPLTKAESTNYQETSSYADVVSFLDGLQRAGAPMRLEYIGTSTKGKPIPLVVAARPLPSSPQDAARMGRPIVYVQANIHAGEVEGKEAILHLLRRYSQEKEGILDKIVLLVNPIYNSDGNDEFGPQERHRPGQNGPAQVGLRPNGQGLDLNRDFVKAESPEMRAALRSVWTAYRPHVMMDLHTTDGTRHGYPLTYAPPLNPNGATGLYEFGRDVFMPEVRSRLRATGIETLDYGNDETRAGVRGWYVVGPEGRYSTNYAGLVDCIGVLSEAIVYDSFEKRIQSTERFTDEVLQSAARHSSHILDLAKQAADPDSVVARIEMGVRFETRSRGVEDVLLERKTGERRTGPVTDIETVKMEVYDRFVASRKTPVPEAFLLPADHQPVAELLARHGVIVEQLDEEWRGQVDEFVVSEARQAAQPFQGHRLITLDGAFRGATYTAAKGDYLVSIRQALGELAFHILHPLGDDGALTWGFLGDEAPAVGSVFPIRLTDTPVLAARHRVPAPD
ncbi:MAG: M14 family metallopeptidase [Fimbriimonadaceae bacterium]